jgi:hypothetical protein
VWVAFRSVEVPVSPKSQDQFVAVPFPYVVLNWIVNGGLPEVRLLEKTEVSGYAVIVKFADTFDPAELVAFNETL